MSYPVPARRHRVEQVIDRSRFITTVDRAASAAEAREVIDAMRAEFADATHNCWAYVAGPPGNTASIGMSDAGEPHGTAGRPMLDVLLHSGVGDIVAVVTRYYGGTKLGTGGLVRAYAGSVQQAMAELPTILKVERRELTVAVQYADIDALKRVCQEFEATIVSEQYDERARYTVAVPLDVLADFSAAVRDRTAGRATVQG